MASYVIIKRTDDCDSPQWTVEHAIRNSLNGVVITPFLNEQEMERETARFSEWAARYQTEGVQDKDVPIVLKLDTWIPMTTNEPLKAW